jgi:hypothetical protein
MNKYRTIGIAPSAKFNPERTFPSMFEPVHGSAPDIYGKNRQPDRPDLVRGDATAELGARIVAVVAAP